MNVAGNKNINFKGTFFVRANEDQLQDLMIDCANKGTCADYVVTKFNDGSGKQTYLFGTQKQGVALDDYWTDYFIKADPATDAVAITELKKGNPNPLLDNILLQKKFFKENIHKYIETPIEKIKTLNIKNVLKAIKEDRFDLKQCAIKK